MRFRLRPRYEAVHGQAIQVTAPDSESGPLMIECCWGTASQQPVGSETSTNASSISETLLPLQPIGVYRNRRHVRSALCAVLGSPPPGLPRRHTGQAADRPPPRSRTNCHPLPACLQPGMRACHHVAGRLLAIALAAALGLLARPAVALPRPTPDAVQAAALTPALRRCLLRLDARLVDGSSPAALAEAAGGRLWSAVHSRTVPLAVVFPRTATAVGRAVRCAKRAGVKVTARSGGGSFLGYSVRPGTLTLDLSELDGVTVAQNRRSVRVQVRHGSCHQPAAPAHLFPAPHFAAWLWRAGRGAPGSALLSGLQAGWAGRGRRGGDLPQRGSGGAHPG